jgi:serine protease Do
MPISDPAFLGLVNSIRGAASAVNRSNLSVTVAAAVLLLTSTVAPARGQTLDGVAAALAVEEAITQAIERSQGAVVSLCRYRLPPGDGRDGLDRFRGDPGLGFAQNEPRDILPNQFSSGVLVPGPRPGEPMVLTVYHAIRGAPVLGQPDQPRNRLVVHLANGHQLRGALVAADPRSDLAVVQLDWAPSGLNPADVPTIAFGVGQPVRKGQFVITLGNPYWIARDGSASAAWGIVSNISRRPALLDSEPRRQPSLHGLGGFMQLDHRLPIGSSGSPVINLRGELVAIASSAAAIEGFDRSGGFAIPLDRSLRWIVETLLKGEEVEYGFLGLKPRRQPTSLAALGRADFARASAVLVEDVYSDSPADEAGVRIGDVILAVDQQPIATDLDLMRVVTLYPPETEVGLRVWRPSSEEELTLTAKLGKWPVKEEEAVVVTHRKFAPWRGLSVDYPTGRDRFFRDQSAVVAGVVVVDVRPGSAAAEARLQPGEFVTRVNRVNVRTPREFADAVQGQAGEVTLQVLVGDGSPQRSVTIPASTAAGEARP